MTGIALLIVSVIAGAGAIACMALALFHAFGMIRGIRASSEWWVNLIPFVAFVFTEALDASGQAHREKFVRWAFLAAALSLVAVALQHVVDTQHDAQPPVAADVPQAARR